MRFLLIVFLSLVPAIGHAESRFGLVGGINYSNFRGMGDGIDWQGFFFPGVYADLQLTPELFVSPQVRYMRKGASFSDMLTLGILDVELAIKFVELPIYLKYKFPSGTTLRPQIFGGPAFGYRVGESLYVKNRITGDTVTYRHLESDSLRKYDIAMEAGAGVEFMLTTDMVGTLALTYSHGLIDLDKDATKIKTQGIRVSASVGF